MSQLFRPLTRLYGRWMDNWENTLCFRATDRVVRTFDYGLEWAAAWPCEAPASLAHECPAAYIRELNRQAVENSPEFYGYETPTDFSHNGEWLISLRRCEHPIRRITVQAQCGFPQRRTTAAPLSCCRTGTRSSATECALRRSCEARYFSPSVELAVSRLADACQS